MVPVSRMSHAAAGLVGSASHSDAEIGMPTHQAFDNQYLLRGQDESALRRVFTDGYLTFFGQNAGWMIEGDGTRLLLNRLNPD